jgi:predicted transposase YdaD
MPPTPHDALFKAAFSHPDLAASELALLLPLDVQAQIDLSTLVLVPGSFVDEELQHAHADLLFAVDVRGGGEALLYVLFEHQSTFDQWLPLRLLRYMLRIWERWQHDHPGVVRIPIVLPVVLHHGEDAWMAAPALASVLEASPELLASTWPLVPHFQFLLDDLALECPDTLAARPLASLSRLVQLALWASRSFARLQDAAPFMQVVAAALAPDERTNALLVQFFRYVFRTAPRDVDVQTIRTILMKVAGPHGQEAMMDYEEQLIERGRAEGKAEGRVEGEARGRAEGEARALLQILTTRGLTVPADARARILACQDLTQLEAWLARAVTVASVAELLGS